MNARLLSIVAACIGCQGEPVVAATTDSGSSGCLLAGSILPNGEFTSGSSNWSTYNVKTESIDGPCGGRALRVYDAKEYGNIGQILTRPFPRGSTVRMRAYFKGLPATVAAPSILLRFHHMAGGVDVSTQEAGSIGQSSGEWLPTDAVAKLEVDEESVDVVVTSRSQAVDEFAVAAVSVVVEPP